MAQIAPLGKYRAFDADGNPLAGGKLYTYEAGTSTPKATFTDKSGTTPNANPVILDADGYANVWLDVGGYKFSLFDANDVLQFTVDDIDGGAAGGFASQVVSRSSSFSLGVNEQNVVNVCTSPLTVSLLPAATAGDGFASIIVNLSGGNVTIDPDGSETINNAATLVVSDGNSATVSTDGVEWYAFGYTQSELRDSQFRIIDNADTTKKLAFEVSGITTGTTRTITVTDTSLAIPANATAASSLILAEDTDNGVNTVQIIAPSAITSNRVLTLPDEDGTVVSTARTASTSQTGIVELATDAEVATGTSTTLVPTVSQLAGVVISSQTASASANLSFTSGISATYSRYEFQLINIKPATDDVALNMLMSTDGGSIYLSSGYQYQVQAAVAGSGPATEGSAAASVIQLTKAAGGSAGVGNASGECYNGVVRFINPAGSQFKTVESLASYINAAGTLVHSPMSGTNNTTTAVNAVRFQFSSGNIASGTIRLVAFR